MPSLKRLLSRSWQTHLNRGDSLREKGDLHRALSKYRAALELHQGEPEQRWELEERVESVRLQLHESHLNAARHVAKTGDTRAVADALYAAAQHAYTGAEKREVDETRAELLGAPRSEEG